MLHLLNFSIDKVSSNRILLCCYLKRFIFSLNASLYYLCKFSLIRFCLFVAWNFHTKYVLPFLFSAHFCSVDICVLCNVSGPCDQSSFALFYLVFWSPFRYIDVILNALFRFLFLAHTVCLRHLRNVCPYASSWMFLFSGHLLEFFYCSL